MLRGGYKIVTDPFGRLEIETFVALDAFKGEGGEARFLCREDISIPLNTDLTPAFAREIELAPVRATQPDIVAAVVGLDPRNWKFVRVLVSAQEPHGSERGTSYQIVHLAHPLLETLPRGVPR